ncbi:hypothetical protein GCM10007160_18330 [Litchfieldella qijiaojingensis]|uniref:Phage tail protein n=1 Tax=Litchfieldella qijiaojingensis TaxID=980347 RepID=A0ABQ2YSN3_9GAMM|nr:hypothetical protein [Halomonas qijiaojingensis]GGX91175.1 hypothetical protein GCM10007160_18330 [Halomonas qijiaojingensis]
MLAATTELEAINSMLTTIGESPVSSVDDTGVVDAAIAHQILQEVSREVQGRGWHFNTEIDYPMSPTYPDKEIVIPDNAMEVDTVGTDTDKEVVVRGRRLYDRKNHTYKFDSTIKVTMIILLPFEDLPQYAREYISMRAARIFQKRTIGSAELDGFTAQDEARTLVHLENSEARTADLNVFNGNYSILRVLDR